MSPSGRIDPLLAVLAGLAAGLLLTWLHHPRAGMYAVSAALGAAALLRLLLRPGEAGLLVVRSRGTDVALLGLLAAGVFVLATVTPFPPPGG